MRGSQLPGVITHAQWEDAQIHTGTQSHIQTSKTCRSLCSYQEKRAFVVLTFSVKCTKCTHSRLLKSYFFMHVHPLSNEIVPDIYELGLTCILLLSLLLLCISRGEGSNIRPSRGRGYHCCNHRIGLIYDLCRAHDA